MRRLLGLCVLVGVFLLVNPTTALAQVDTTVPLGAPEPSAVTTTTNVDPTVSTLPPDCTPPKPPDVVFIGRIIDATAGTGRFIVTVIRSDPSKFLTEGRAVDVRIGADVRFLVLNQNYLIAAEHTPDNVLRSKVRQPLPVFGGDLVVGIDDYGPSCPALSDPIVVRNDDGTAIDTGVLSAFLDDRRGIALALIKPMIGVALALIAFWALKRLAVYAAKGLGDILSQR
ncbi:MAG: hypothetical protein F2873_04580 [Actinobacteria bacterium]|uniref:Unannotated protein n=1 Tax=freshwater metagenome TaxID=449393 RepID=A0A6J7N8B6_9ZZZZ|nr:hypothetical protein [Actinomycetota bacterium]MSX80879.1 hypothetical protein [Actinomycetota bacterium]